MLQRRKGLHTRRAISTVMQLVALYHLGILQIYMNSVYKIYIVKLLTYGRKH
jgi:hypothetical protein